MPTKLSMSAADWLLLVALSVLWGGSFFFAKVAVDDLPPLTLALGRVAIAAAILVVLVRVRGESLAPIARAAHSASEDARERADASEASGQRDVWAQLACLAAAMSYALAGVYGRRFAPLPPVTVAAGQLIAATVLLVPLSAFVDRPWTLAPPSAAALGALLALAALSTALAYVIYFRILTRAGATNLLLVTFLIPVSAIMLGTIVLGERLSSHHFAGMAVIALGLAAIDGRPADLIARAIRR